MASPREAIDTLLKADSTLSNLVGARFYFERATEKNLAYPYIRYSCVSGVPDVLLDGSISSVDQRWQFDIFAETARACEQIREQLISVLKLLNTLVSVTNPADGVAAVKLLGSSPVSWMEPRQNWETGRYELNQDFMMFFGRAA